METHQTPCRDPYVKNLPVNPNTNLEVKTNFSVPIFVLHAKGSFYVPVTIDYNTLLPFLQNYDLLEVLPGGQNIVLHPVTINVNFQPQLRPTKNDFSSKWN